MRPQCRGEEDPNERACNPGAARRQVRREVHVVALLDRSTVLAIALAAIASQSGAAAKRLAAVPILIELFTSEGCSTCPPADQLLEKLIATQPTPGIEIVGLGEHVDYWDRLGWRDRFSSPAYTDRQRSYGTALEIDDIYTPTLRRWSWMGGPHSSALMSPRCNRRSGARCRRRTA
jgi:hypothetical protein